LSLTRASNISTSFGANLKSLSSASSSSSCIAYVSLRQHMSAYVSIRQNTSAYLLFVVFACSALHARALALATRTHALTLSPAHETKQAEANRIGGRQQEFGRHQQTGGHSSSSLGAAESSEFLCCLELLKVDRPKSCPTRPITGPHVRGTTEQCYELQNTVGGSVLEKPASRK
jgi:hypothetical protein